MSYKYVQRGLTLISLSVASLLASAQTAAPTPPASNDAAEEELLPEVSITGSRIRKDAYTSASPVQIITSERSTLEGLSDTAQVLQESAVASGSGQINTLFGGYLVDGGPGVQTLSLRGLGAQRTLILLNGRRLPPAGVGGTVGPVDLNIIPNSIVNRIELLKDGASSIYGSDAVAGVVNVITKTRASGGRINGQFNATPDGADTYTVDGTWGWAGESGGLSVSGEWYKINQLKMGERPRAACGLDLLTADVAGNVGAIARYGIPARAVQPGDSTDLINPFTGKPVCWSTQTGWANIYSSAWASRGSITNLPRGPGYVPATGTAAQAEPTLAPGWRRLSSFEISEPTQVELDSDLIPRNERRTLYAQGDWRFNSAAEVYGELLYTQRESEQKGVRQLFPFVSVESDINPTGYYFYPIVGMLPYGADQDVKVSRGLAGLRGDIGKWRYDTYLSHSHSNADYNQDVVPYDRLEAATGTYQDHADPFLQGELIPDGVCGPSAPVGCVPFASLFSVAGLRYGQYNPDELAYVTAVDRGNTKYDQTIFEAQATGDLLQLPAGPLAAAFGVQFRRDEIKDVPGQYSLNDNSWGFTTSGITEGSDNVKEVYAELEVPLLSGLPMVQDLSLNLSGRYSDYKTVGSATTYKFGVNWKMTDMLRLRSTYGTSFRGPALYELYLKDQSGFLSQFSIDPCVNWADPDLNKSQIIQTNCAAAGIPGDYDGNRGSALIVTGGGLGLLEPETSRALSVGFVITPPGTGFSLAVDYWDIKVEDEISGSSAGIVGRCYSDPNFDPNSGFCSSFTRLPGDADNDGEEDADAYMITEVNAQYRNIPTQRTKGFDANLSYIKDLSFGKLEIEGEATRTTYDKAELYPSEVYNYNGLIGEPKWTANAQIRLKRGDFTYAWTTNFIGGEDNVGYEEEDGLITVSYAGPSRQITSVPDVFIHDVSARYKGDKYEVTAGVTNVLNREPPQVSYGVTGAPRLGTIPLTSQYYSLLLGRVGFMSLSRKF